MRADKAWPGARKITTVVSGGLGNQLFQFAAGKASQLLGGGSLDLDVSWYFKAQKATPRQYYLGAFPGLQILRQHKVRLTQFLVKKYYTWARRVAGYPVLEVRNCIYQFDKRIFDPRFRRVFLSGVWQNIQYLDSAGVGIFDNLKKMESKAQFDKQLLQQIHNNESVSVHVRRGDYVSGQLFQCRPEYYEGAIKFLEKKIGKKPKAFFFSDEPEKLGDLVRRIPGSRVIGSKESSGVLDDFFLMRECRHHIIANSTFSWWAAWLADRSVAGKSQEKYVVAPSRWFCGVESSRINIYPNHWKVLPT